MKLPVCFFGCSHVGALASAAWRAKLPIAGRGIANGRTFYENRFDFAEDGAFTIDNPKGMERYAEFLKEAGVANFRELRGAVLVTSLGFQLDLQIWAIAERFTLDPKDATRQYLSAAAFKSAILGRRQKIFALLDWMKGFGIDVISFGPPPRNENRFLINTAEDLLAEELRRRGIAVHVPRHWAAGKDGMLKLEYIPTEKPNDRVHGNPAYGEELFRQIRPLIEERLALAGAAAS